MKNLTNNWELTEGTYFIAEHIETGKKIVEENIPGLAVKMKAYENSLTGTV